MAPGRKAAAFILTALLAVTLCLGACKVPEDQQPADPNTPQPRPPDERVDESRAAMGLMGVPRTDKITFDIFGKTDPDRPAIVHLTAYPVVKPEIIADHPDARLMIELQVPYGVQIEAGRFRHRAPLRNINKQKIKTDLRILNSGTHTLRVVGTILGEGGELIVEGDSPYKVNSRTDGTIDFVQEEPEAEPGDTTTGGGDQKIVLP